MATTHTLVLVILAVDKHHIAGIAVVVVGAALAVFGALRALRRASGAALIALAGIAIVVIGVLTYTHTIHS